MDDKLCKKFVTDNNFINFCNTIDVFRLKGKSLTKLEIASLLLDSNVNFVKGDHFVILCVVIREFLSHAHSFRMSMFHDFFISSLILYDVDKYEFNKTMIISQYIENIINCSCGYTPIIDTKKIKVNNILMGCITCKKCGLSVNVILTQMRFYWDSAFACWEVESGIKEMIWLWNQEVNKKENIVHRTIRELLEYVPYAGNNSDKSKLSTRLKIYVSEKIDKEKSLGSDILADFLMECKEPVQWVEDYLWENMPCKIGA